MAEGTAPRRTPILVIGVGSEAYGRERRLVNLFRHAPGIEPFFLVPRWGDGSVASLLRANGFDFTPAPFGYLGGARLRYTAVTLSHLPRLTAMVLQEYRRRGCAGILIAHLNGFLNALLPVLFLRATGARVVFHLGDWVPRSAAYRALAPLVAWVASRIITNSQAGKEDLVGLGLDPSRIEVVYNGLRLEEFDAAIATDHRQTYGWPRETTLIGWAGRFTSAKGAWEFVRAAEMVAREAPHCRFVMFGKTNHLDSCQPEIAAWVRERGLQGLLAFAGHVCDMPAAYAGLDVMVVPSVTETLPNVILEAMASALPVVASRVAGIPEVVVDGTTGLLVPPQDSPALARAITRLAVDEDERRRFGERGRQEASLRFDAWRNAALLERAILGQS